MLENIEKIVYEGGITAPEARSLLIESQGFLASLSDKCGSLERVYLSLLDNPITSLIRMDGEAADEEYFYIQESQQRMLGNLKTELTELNLRYLRIQRLILAVRTLPEQYRLPIEMRYCEGRQWKECTSALDITTTTLSRRLNKGINLVVKLYNMDRSNEELIRSYLDIQVMTSKEKERKKKSTTANTDEDMGHQMSLAEYLG